MKVYLIGMPGAGKSTLGKQLAESLQLPFVDLDAEIEKKESRSIKDIFSENGEDFFRLTESQTLRAWAESEKSFVMATGGGAPCFYHGIDAINTTGTSIFLDVPIEELILRVRNNKDRPLLNAEHQVELEDRLTTLHEKRLKVYRQAKFVITDPDLQKVMEVLQLKK